MPLEVIEKLCAAKNPERSMSVNRKERRVLQLAIGGVAAIAFLQWLRSDPHCNRGCQTQLQHLQEHVVDNLIRGFLA